MQFILVISAALIPGLFWMWWYYRQDVYNKEPKTLLAKVFILSMPLSLLIGLFEYVVDQAILIDGKPLSQSNNILLVVLFYLFVVGLTEELGKFVVTYVLAYQDKAFDEELDGIIYSAASGLGFATFENIFFILDQGPFIILLRGPVSTLAHVLFSALWGAALGLARFDKDPKTGRRRILIGLGLAVLTHAIFDLLITLGARIVDWGALSSLVFLAVLYIIVRQQILHALDISRFNPASSAFKRLRQQLSPEGRRAARQPNYVPNTYLKKPLEQDPNPQSDNPSDSDEKMQEQETSSKEQE